ncbi:MAG: hypothetical protein Q9212_005109 [Teloschistes hypoglaucus]
MSVVADLAPPHERGQYVGAALCGYATVERTSTQNPTRLMLRRPNTAPSLGPVLGGVLAERASWRWIFWFLAILSGFCLLLIIAFLPETGRKIVGNGSIQPTGINRSLVSRMARSKNERPVPEATTQLRLRVPNPISCLRIVFHKDTALVLVANAVFYMNYSCMQASLAPLLMNLYGLNALQLNSPPGKAMNHDYRKTAAEVGFTVDKTKGDDLATFPIEKARLRSIWYFVSVSTACTIGCGWTLQARTVRTICHCMVIDTDHSREASSGTPDPPVHLRSRGHRNLQRKSTTFAHAALRE